MFFSQKDIIIGGIIFIRRNWVETERNEITRRDEISFRACYYTVPRYLGMSSRKKTIIIIYEVTFARKQSRFSTFYNQSRKFETIYLYFF